ncbi:hypothetical protein OF376_01930 [Ureaplasma miroungigenitalium]|uniref:DUF2382 domain-containing protein n=1 Tax=Ureaplasma miroungigenitalium TaxID=1042321 RepID=A0ABT3BMS7_9BACT|nr:hypothetical protein [Ureaplasma miroungigenitalium]MCV3728522.1 hypothetical protein [Ureaplasma miroungigenitalium]MCV3734513.1 hypothetical protein [Ureaplasma miroungigenitalium]
MNTKNESKIKSPSDLRNLYNETNSIRNRLLKVEYCGCEKDLSILEHQEHLLQEAKANDALANHDGRFENCETNIITAEHQTLNIDLDIQTCTNDSKQVVIQQAEPIIKEVEKIVYVDRPVEVEKIVIKEVEKIVEKVVEVPKETITSKTENKETTPVEPTTPKTKAKGPSQKTVKYRKLKNNGMSEAGLRMLELLRETRKDEVEANEKYEEELRRKEKRREERRLARLQKAQEKKAAESKTAA